MARSFHGKFISAGSIQLQLSCTFSNNGKKCKGVRPNQYSCSNRISGTVMCVFFVLFLCTAPLWRKVAFATREIKVLAFRIQPENQWECLPGVENIAIFHVLLVHGFVLFRTTQHTHTHTEHKPTL